MREVRIEIKSVAEHEDLQRWEDHMLEKAKCWNRVDSPVADCQPNENVEAMRVFMLGKKVECRPVWKPMHKQRVRSHTGSEQQIQRLIPYHIIAI